MDLLNPVFTEKAECQDCYKCLRECTVKAIKVEGGRAAIVPELCVLCGHCVQVCPVGAKKVRDDLSRAKHLVSSGKKVIVSLAPSFVTEFPGVAAEHIIASLKKLGIWMVSETARGADLVARSVADKLCGGASGSRNPLDNLFISSACPTVVEYIKKYRPYFASCVTDLYSPLQAHARELKALFGDDIAILFIGPCISKKRESDTKRDLVDVVIDFKDLGTWFKEEAVYPAASIPAPDDLFMPERAGKGSMYPVDGGMIETIRQYPIPAEAELMAFSGIEDIDRALAELEQNPVPVPVFLELLACPGGCVNGPRSRSREATVHKRLSVFSYAHKTTRVPLATVSSLEYCWNFSPVKELAVTEDEIAQALRRTGKYSREDELNCGGCGYDTCRDFAQAMVAGKAEQDMCVSYMRKLAQKKANSLIKSIPSAVVIVNKDLRIVECNAKFALIAGEDARQLWEAKPGLEGAELAKLIPFYRYFRDVLQGAETVDRDIRIDRRIIHATIFGIERGEYAGAVFQDITEPWVRKDRIVSQARNVISKNLAVVQKIAYLLGENAAETEATLSSIIESYESEQESAKNGLRR